MEKDYSRLLDLTLDPNAGYPLWLVICLVLLNGVSFFWNHIKSSVEIGLKGKTTIDQKKVDHDLLLKLKKYEEEKSVRDETRQADMKEDEAKDLELKTLAERLRAIEEQNIKLRQANTALSMAILFMIDKYEKDHPEDKTLIARVKKIIEENHIE